MIMMFITRTRFSYDGKVLRITRAVPTDTGRYTCQAVNSAGQADQRFRLSVLGKTTACSRAAKPGVRGAAGAYQEICRRQRCPEK